MIGQSEKILKIEKLFDKIQELFPDKSVTLTIHSIDMEKLPKHWIVEKSVTESNSILVTAKRNDKTFDIVLFK